VLVPCKTRGVAGTPLWPFGFGLSYTTFSYQWSAADSVSVTTDAMLAHDKVYYASGGTTPSPALYTVVVTNTGGVASDCVVLGFVSSGAAGAPLSELFDFARVTLAPGQQTTVYLSVPPSVLAMTDERGVSSLRAGEYGVSIGDSLARVTGTLRVEGEPRVVFKHPSAV
jgi:hypothetical protein